MRRRDAFEVEAADLEPIALEPSTPPACTPRPRPSPVWLVVAVVVAVVWGAIAFATRQHSESKTAPPGPASAAAPSHLPTSFVENFAGIGTGRFAVVVNGYLYTLDGGARSSALVGLGDGAEPVTIEDQSGRELLVRTQHDNVILDTTGAGTMSVPADRSALPSYSGSWSFVASDRTPQSSAIVATFGGQFIVRENHGFALWDGAHGPMQPIAPGATKLLTGGGGAALFAASCPSPCDKLVYADGRTRTFATPTADAPALLSPDTRRVVIGNSVIDTTTGRVLVAHLSFPVGNTPLSYTWTGDETLLTANAGAVSVLRPNESDTDEIIGLNGISQIVALP